MLETILKLYTMFMATGARSPLPHLIGPPGCGKSTWVEQAAELVGVNLHVINVSRLNPLEAEGVQMPHTNVDDEMILKFLPATFWTDLREGDFLLLDEFLRGFPEVYNAILDILTSRRVGSYTLPKVFIIAASNTNVAYDAALTDRLLHITVPDIRKDKPERKRIAKLIVDVLGLLPEMADSYEMTRMLDGEVGEMYSILDAFKNGTSQVKITGSSVRKLIGQAQLRHIESAALLELISINNQRACRESKWQYVLLPDGKAGINLPNYEDRAKGLVGNPKLTEVQATNLNLNLQLIEMERIRFEKEGTTTDDDTDIDLDDLLS